MMDEVYLMVANFSILGDCPNPISVKRGTWTVNDGHIPANLFIFLNLDHYQKTLDHENKCNHHPAPDNAVRHDGRRPGP
jgi:hypothetical protein